MFVSLKSAPMASWKTAIILVSRQSLFSAPCVCVCVYSSSYTCACMCAHDQLWVHCACVRVCECESVIVTWLIHHGQSPFDYKRRGPVINRWIQLPGRSCDTRSQSICTGTPPLAPLPCSSVPPYRPHPYTHTHTCTKYPPLSPHFLPNVTFCPCLASNNTHLTLSFSSSSALPPLYSSDFCFILAQTLPLGSPSPPSPVPPYILSLPLCTPHLCTLSSCSHNLSFSNHSVQPTAWNSPKHYCFDLITFCFTVFPLSYKLWPLHFLFYIYTRPTNPFP